jgi:hypothetical protein
LVALSRAFPPFARFLCYPCLGRGRPIIGHLLLLAFGFGRRRLCRLLFRFRWLGLLLWLFFWLWLFLWLLWCLTSDL